MQEDEIRFKNVHVAGHLLKKNMLEQKRKSILIYTMAIAAQAVINNELHRTHLLLPYAESARRAKRTTY